MDEIIQSDNWEAILPITILPRGRFLIPSISDDSFPFKGTECEICGLVFIDMVEQEVFEEHMVRCVDRKVEEYKNMQANGYKKSEHFGWVKL